MQHSYWLTFTLESEAIFGRGDGVPGVVDIEVAHDHAGLPMLGGRGLKGLLHAEAHTLVAALKLGRDATRGAAWERTEQALFGKPGSTLTDAGRLHVGDASLHPEVVAWFRARVEAKALTASDVLRSLTTIRQQTALAEDGAPKQNTLRASRVILRESQFYAPLLLEDGDDGNDMILAFLAACIKAFRRAGTNKTRGAGRLQADLRMAPDGPSVLDETYRQFSQAVRL